MGSSEKNCCCDDMSAMPPGIDMEISKGDDSVFSGSQRQRVLIARDSIAVG